MKRLITLAAIAVLALTACDPDAPAQPSREDLARQADHQAMAMLSWEVQSAADREDVCAKVRVRGQDGTQRAWAEQQGGDVSDWGPATTWLIDACEKAGY